MPTVIIVHRWWGNSESDWIPWLKDELEKKGVTVIAPDMPDPNAPKIETWVPFLADVAKDANEDYYLVGHSVGCSAVLRYLASLPEATKVGGVVLVAPWPKSAINLSEEENPLAKPWLETPIDWDAARKHSDRFVVIYSDDDPYVPTENATLLAEKLGAKLLLDSNRGHFTEEEDVTELPVLLKELLAMMRMPYEEPLI